MKYENVQYCVYIHKLHLHLQGFQKDLVSQTANALKLLQKVANKSMYEDVTVPEQKLHNHKVFNIYSEKFHIVSSCPTHGIIHL